MLNERNIPLEEDGIEEEILVDEEIAITKAMWGDIGGNIENQTDLQNALDAKQDQLSEAQLNAVNSGITAGKVATYDGYADQIASKANQSALNAEATTREQADTALGRRIDDEATARQNADNGLQNQIDAITSQSDVVDVVANYAALQAYDTSSLSDNDVIKVLDDETHEDALTYYRWSTTTQTWSYIGQEAPYYSKGQMDVMLQGKQDKLTAGANIQIQNGTISATDTKYTNGNGLNLNGTEFSADTDVLATKEDLEDYYTKPETDNLLAPKLEAEVVAELPTTGEEGKLYLTPKAHTTQTATGNPITASVTEEAGALESFQMDGDTFQQSYDGGNLFDGTIEVGSISSTTGEDTEAQDRLRTAGLTPTGFGGQISITATNTGQGTLQCAPRFYRADGSFIGNAGIGWNTMPATINPTTNTAYIRLIFRYTSDVGQDPSNIQDLQIKAPAVPSPDYPQPIQTVTGEQTVTINSTTYPISLGSIELCKLGAYQDYILKDGSDWKVHKAISKNNIDGTTGTWSNPSANRFNLDGAITGYAKQNGLTGYCEDYVVLGQTSNNSDFNTLASNYGFAINFGSQSSNNIRFKNTACSTIQEIQTALASNSISIYCALDTATDTTITDSTLIAQLEAIRTASLQNGANTITNTATGSNLAGDMEIGYYGFAPRNRYDKWLWLDINNEYEQIGS